MEYPGSKFKKPYRTAMFMTFVLAFFIISPLTILYTAGYRFDIKNGLLRETGSISIDILPKKVNVWLDGILLNYNIPIRLNDIAPHKYQLKLSLLGYYDWQKEIEVNNKQTTYIKDIILIKKESPELLLKGSISEMNLSSDQHYLAYVLEKGKKKSVWIRNLNSNQENLAAAFSDSGELKLTWAKNNNFLLITDDNLPYKKATVISAEDVKDKSDLIKLFGKEINKFEWKESTSPELYYSNNQGIFSFYNDNKQTSLISENKYIDWYMEGGELWTLQTSTSSPGLSIIKNTLGFKEIFGNLNFTDGQLATLPPVSWKINFTHNNNLLLSNDAWGGNFLIAKQNGQFNLPGKNAYISPYNDWWMIWTPFELWTYIEGETPYLLNRSAEELKNVIPIDQNNTLALMWKKNTTALFPYYLIHNELINKEGVAMTVDSKNRIIFFSDAEGLWKLNY